MRGGNHGKVKIECSVDPEIANAMLMLRAVNPEAPDDLYRHRLSRYVAECVETYIPEVFRRTFGITIVEFRKRFPKPRVKQLPVIARELAKRKEAEDDFYRSNPVARRCAAAANV